MPVILSLIDYRHTVLSFKKLLNLNKHVTEIKQTVTYEVVFEIWMHVINSVIHNSRCDALAREAEGPRRLHVQIKLRYTTRLTCVVLRKQ